MMMLGNPCQRIYLAIVGFDIYWLDMLTYFLFVGIELLGMGEVEAAQTQFQFQCLRYGGKSPS